MKSKATSIHENVDLIEEVRRRQEEESARYYVLLDIYEARQKLLNYKIELSVKGKEPTYGGITFLHDDLKRFDAFKKYA